MKDPKRIKKVLDLIERYWNNNDQMRLGQMLINLGVAKDSWLWGVEDDEWEKIIKEKLKR